MLDRESQRRLKEIVRRVIATPTLPILGITKTFEAVVVGGEFVAWLGFTVLVSGGYVFADNIGDAADELTD